MTKILITGSGGQVGRELQQLGADFPEADFVFATRNSLDITDAPAVRDLFAEGRFDYCINCAAYTAVDKAESEKDRARAINVGGVQNIATACKDHQCRLIHLSSDYVYDNGYNRPLVESDPVNPQSVYARTKLKGDQIALEILPDSLIIRTSWVYSSFGHNFVKTMLRLGRERDSLNIVFDQVGTPTYARHLAAALLQIIDRLRTREVVAEGGIYHYSNEGVCSWYDFALAIFELEGISCEVRPIVSREFPTPARRPHYSVLNKQKIRETFGLSISHWRKGLEDCLSVIEK